MHLNFKVIVFVTWETEVSQVTISGLFGGGLRSLDSGYSAYATWLPVHLTNACALCCGSIFREIG